MQFRFGTGSAFMTPVTDNNGSIIATPTPIKGGVVQMVNLDHSFDTKPLFGENGIAVDIAGGKQKIDGKLELGQVSAAVYALLVFGVPFTTASGNYVADNLSFVVPATPFTITPTPPQGGTFGGDLGVRDSQGVPMTRVTGTPTTGQYAVSATGVYTFAAADVGKAVYTSFKYTAATGKRISVVNSRMGSIPSFAFDYGMLYEGRNVTLNAYNCVRKKVGLIGTKIDDFDTFSMDFEVFADPVSGRVLDLTFTD